MQVQVQHRDRRDRKQQSHRQGADPGLGRQQPERCRQTAGERNDEAWQGDFHALAVQAQVDHVAEDVPQQQRKREAVKVLQPHRRHQLRAAELPARLDPEIHQQRQAERRQQQLADNRDQPEATAYVGRDCE
ncbi:hypothetical protein D9M68_946610 [compost metagenome]